MTDGLLDGAAAAGTVTTVRMVGVAVYVVGLAAAFGVRSWLHRRRTGSSGFHGVSGRPGSASWWGGVLFVFALLLGLAAPALTGAGVLSVPDGDLAAGLAIAGFVLLVLGVAGVLVAQTGMGTSWRIGVDPTDRTALVTGGVFAVVRNPIFTAMITTQAGFVLLVPSAVSVTALACLVAAIELQVRLLEEPHLQTTHGEFYRGYARRTGRFLPGIGRLRPATPVAVP